MADEKRALKAIDEGLRLQLGQSPKRKERFLEADLGFINPALEKYKKEFTNEQAAKAALTAVGIAVKYKLIDESIIYNYFEYIKPKLGFESIFRLLSPLLSIFFSVPHSKIYKYKINEYMKDQKINLIEDLLIKFVSKRNIN